MRVLVVDDEPDVASLISMGISLHRPEYAVTEVHGGDAALASIRATRPDLVVLDLAMPERDGFSVLAELREESDLPVIVLTAKGLESEKVRGLELGADDYMTKPFSHKELIARIDAVLRRYRSTASRAPTTFLWGDLRVDFGQRRVQRGDREIKLTPTEYDLLQHLVANAGQVMTHDALLVRIWGPEYRNEVHYLKVYIARLRNKLEDDPAKPRLLLTVRGVGYRCPGPDEVVPR